MMYNKPNLKAPRDIKLFEQGRLDAIAEILTLVRREYSTRDNIDLEEHLRRLFLLAEREIRRER